MPSFLPPKTPRSVTIILWGVFILGMVSLWQAVAIAGQTAVLQSLNGSIIALVVQQWMAVVWAAVFFVVLIALRFKRPWSRTAVPVALSVYTLYHLFTRFLAQSANLHQEWVIWILITIVALVFSLWALRRPAVSPYFNN